MMRLLSRSRSLEDWRFTHIVPVVPVGTPVTWARPVLLSSQPSPSTHPSRPRRWVLAAWRTPSGTLTSPHDTARLSLSFPHSSSSVFMYISWHFVHATRSALQRHLALSLIIARPREYPAFPGWTSPWQHFTPRYFARAIQDFVSLCDGLKIQTTAALVGRKLMEMPATVCLNMSLWLKAKNPDAFLRNWNLWRLKICERANVCMRWAGFREWLFEIMSAINSSHIGIFV